MKNIGDEGSLQKLQGKTILGIESIGEDIYILMDDKILYLIYKKKDEFCPSVRMNIPLTDRDTEIKEITF